MDFTSLPLLTGTRVVLEPLALTHVADLAEAVAVGDLSATWYARHIAAPDDMADDVAARIASFERGESLPWAIVDRASGRAAGLTAFLHLSPENRRLEIGSTWLGRDYQRTGINTEAKLLLLTHAFAGLKCIAVEFRTHWHNRQSREAILRLGAKQDGVLRNHQLWADGTMRDTVVFSIVESEWPTVRRSLEMRLVRGAGA